MQGMAPWAAIVVLFVSWIDRFRSVVTVCSCVSESEDSRSDTSNSLHLPLPEVCYVRKLRLRQFPQLSGGFPTFLFLHNLLQQDSQILLFFQCDARFGEGRFIPIPISCCCSQRRFQSPALAPLFYHTLHKVVWGQDQVRQHLLRLWARPVPRL